MNNQKNSNYSYAGFTLVELLVVVSIFSLLSSMALAGALNVRVKAQAAAVTKDLLTMRDVFELYKLAHNKYPYECQGPWDTGNAGNGGVFDPAGQYYCRAQVNWWIGNSSSVSSYYAALINEKLISAIPMPPVRSDHPQYRIYTLGNPSDPADWVTCGNVSLKYYTIEFRDPSALIKPSLPQDPSGWYCTGF